MAKEYQPPEFNEAVLCPDCGESSDTMSGYGVIGGGSGPYTMCSRCGIVVTKSFEEPGDPRVIDTTATEVEPNAEIAKDQNN